MGWDGMGDENPTKWKCWERNIEPINFPKQINNFTHIHITLEKMKKIFFCFVYFRYLFFFPIQKQVREGSAAKMKKKEEEERRKV